MTYEIRTICLPMVELLCLQACLVLFLRWLNCFEWEAWIMIVALIFIIISWRNLSQSCCKVTSWCLTCPGIHTCFCGLGLTPLHHWSDLVKKKNKWLNKLSWWRHLRWDRLSWSFLGASYLFIWMFVLCCRNVPTGCKIRYMLTIIAGKRSDELQGSWVYSSGNVQQFSLCGI